MDTNTICAISTPPGQGGIAVIRVSGDAAITIVNALFEQTGKEKGQSTLLLKEGYTLTHGNLMDEDKIIDEVMIALFRGPHSYTGEDTIEISCHGSIYIQQQILQLLIRSGCRIALPGEFTQRAFLNKKMDLSQAEAVADLIASNSAAAHNMAIKQMRGGFSKELNNLRADLLRFVSLIELELDFSEEEVNFANRDQLYELASDIHTHISRLIGSFSVGNALKNGVPVAIVGETNAGKSTLLNLLLNEERALVSNIHGTTRDVIEDTIVIQGVTYRFIDTAGIRKTNDIIENMGIELTYKKIEQASIILWMIDCTQVSEHIEWMARKIVPRSKGKKLILVFNKIDNVNEEEIDVLDNLFSDVDAERIHISAKDKLNINLLEDMITRAAQLPQISGEDFIVNNARHYEALVQADKSIIRVQEGIKNHISGDFLSQDIRECMHYLGEITGEINADEILGNIFSHFCIGK